MSIIFQTLNKLQSAPDGGPESQAAEDVQCPASGPARTRIRRMFLIAGIVTAVLIVLGIGAVLAVRFLVSHLNAAPVEASTAQKINAQKNLEFEDHNIADHFQTPVVKPRFIPPDNTAEPTSGISGPAGQTASPDIAPVPADVQPAGPVAVIDATSKNKPAPPVSAGDQNPQTVVSPRAGPASAADTGIPAIQRSAMIPEALTLSASEPAPLTSEQRQAEKAQRALRERSDRIIRLVGQLEAALSHPAPDGPRVEAMLSDLARLKGPDNPYVEKMRAYWLLKQGRYDQAKALLEKGSLAGGEDFEVGINLAVIDLRTGNAQAALDRLKLLARVYPDNTQIADLIRKLK